MIVLIYAHPRPSHSVAQRALLDAVRDLPGLAWYSLYDRYPDFAIDVAAERAQLATAELVVWQAPLYWYSVPALLKLWFEVVLVRGWAYGDGGNALAGKSCLWVTSTGADADAYAPQGKHGHAFDAFVPHVQQTAQFCGMHWLPPVVLHGAHHHHEAEVEQARAAYRARLMPFAKAI